MECGGCSGGTSSGGSNSGSDFGPASGSNAGPTVISSLWASSGGGTNYGYAYNYTGQEAYIALTKKFPFQYFNELQRVTITTNPDISNALLEFLDTDGNTQSNKDFVVSIIDGIEFGTVNSYKEFSVLLNAYKIILDPSFQNNPCLKGVYTNLGGSTTFQKYLKAFDGKFSVANLKLSVGVDLNFLDVNALTYQPVNYLIQIKFNPNKLKRPSLDIARTFIHELIHAEIYRKLLSVAGEPNIPWTVDFINSLKNNFPGLYDYYSRYILNVPANQQITDEQHELMAAHYRHIIIQTMKDFDNTQNDAVYTALSWTGLMGTGVLNSLTGLPQYPTVSWKNTPQQERLKILDSIKTFLSSNPPCQNY